MTEDSTTPTPDERPRLDGARLPRAQKGGILAGVSAGLGRATGIDPVIFRVAFAILVLTGGWGILLYIAAALLMPAAPERDSVAEQVLKRRFDATAVLTILGMLLTAGVVISLPAIWVFSVEPGVSGDGLGIVAVFALVLLVVRARDVDLVELVRTLPERVQRRPEPVAAQPVSFDKPRWQLEGMIDLSLFGTGRTGTAAVADDSAPAVTKRKRRERSKLTPWALLAALLVAALMIPVAGDRPGEYSTQMVASLSLAVVGAALLLATWFGRARGLVAVGTLLSLTLLTSTVASELPANTRFGDVEWRPMDTSSAGQNHRVAGGRGVLDLTALRLAPGQRVRVDAGLLFGELKITLPRTVRTELDIRVTLGDVQVDGRITGGPNAKVNEVIEAENTKNPPVIELRVRGKLGDIEVQRA